ncbi:MAG: hypothetical protein AAB638_01615 [Patescibacteria group bacterium]
MKALFNKDFLIYSLAVFLVFGVLSVKVRDSVPQPANILSAVETLNPHPVPEDIQEIKPPQKVLLAGRVISKMTYGRLLLKNSDATASYTHFIAEPTDVDQDDPLRESPTTKNITRGEMISIDGKLSANCYWDDTKYNGCVPWVEIVALATKSF